MLRRKPNINNATNFAMSKQRANIDIGLCNLSTWQIHKISTKQIHKPCLSSSAYCYQLSSQFLDHSP